MPCSILSRVKLSELRLTVSIARKVCFKRLTSVLYSVFAFLGSEQTISAQCKYNKFILIGLLLTFKFFTPGFHNSAFRLFAFHC
jgi:hypothetical protein